MDNMQKTENAVRNMIFLKEVLSSEKFFKVVEDVIFLYKHTDIFNVKKPNFKGLTVSQDELIREVKSEDENQNFILIDSSFESVSRDEINGIKKIYTNLCEERLNEIYAFFESQKKEKKSF